MRLKNQQNAPDLAMKDITGKRHIVGRRNSQTGNRGQKTLVSFFREASCPFCNFRLYVLDEYMPKFSARGLRVINIFASTEDEVKRFLLRKPRSMIMVADPEMKQYGTYGIETASQAEKLRALVNRIMALTRGNLLLSGAPGPRAKDSKVLPADFLIDEEGEIVATYYGEDIGDHIPIEKLLLFAT